MVVPTTDCGLVILPLGIPRAFPTKQQASQSSLLSLDQRDSLAINRARRASLSRHHFHVRIGKTHMLSIMPGGYHSVVYPLIYGSERLTRYGILPDGHRSVVITFISGSYSQAIEPCQAGVTQSLSLSYPGLKDSHAINHARRASLSRHHFYLWIGKSHCSFCSITTCQRRMRINDCALLSAGSAGGGALLSSESSVIRGCEDTWNHVPQLVLS